MSLGHASERLQTQTAMASGRLRVDSESSSGGPETRDPSDGARVHSAYDQQSTAETRQAGVAQKPDARSNKRWENGLLNGLRGRVINFTPSWFSVNMGTGITSIILHNLPYQFRGLRTIATIIFALNVFLFVIFLGATCMRYMIWPQIWTVMINHNVQSLFWGTFAMGFATIGDGVVLFCVPAFGGRWITLAWACWWIDVVIAVLVGIGIPFIMFTRHQHQVELVTGVWLLPVVAPIVAAAQGGIVADILPPSDARLTIIISYMLLGLGLPVALLVQALYLQRLAIYKVPPAATVVSAFLPIGPCGQSAFAFLQLAAAIRKINVVDGKALGGSFSISEASTIVSAIYGLSFIQAFFMFGLGIFWMVIAIATSLDLAAHGGFPFNMGWWGFTFPLGTMATSAILMAEELDSKALRIIAMILSVSVTFFWLYVGSRTAIESVKGTVFIAPCLGDAGQPPPSTRSKHQNQAVQEFQATLTV